MGWRFSPVSYYTSVNTHVLGLKIEYFDEKELRNSELFLFFNDLQSSNRKIIITILSWLYYCWEVFRRTKRKLVKGHWLYISLLLYATASQASFMTHDLEQFLLKPGQIRLKSGLNLSVSQIYFLSRAEVS